jgi:hypothetical protein
MLGLFLMGLAAGLILEGIGLASALADFKTFSGKDAIDFLAVFGGTLATFYLNRKLGIGAVLASSLIGFLGALIFKNQATAIFCGSFAGMSDRARLPNEGAACIAGLLCGLVFIHSTPYLGGAGGKLGTIAFGTVIAYSGVD